ncbi:hypothetical protein LZ30DRAFT_721355 [Colletotrichum cereale]|nr:hypothetical protein LZ30DRAFT_721355 [Colletotrichum cereale]
MARLLSHQEASRNTINNGPSHSVHIPEYQGQPPRSPNQSRERAIDYQTSDGQVVDYSDTITRKCPLGTCDQPCQSSDLLQHFQQRKHMILLGWGVSHSQVDVVCREVCVFCFEQFTFASDYISHTLEHHLAENDEVKLNYAEASREKLMAEAERELKALCNKERASVQGLGLSAAKADAYHSLSGSETLSQPDYSAPSNGAFPPWNACPTTESTFIDISPLEWASSQYPTEYIQSGSMAVEEAMQTLYGGPDLLTTVSHQQALSHQQNINFPFILPYGRTSYDTPVPSYTGSRPSTTPEGVASSTQPILESTAFRILPQTMGWSKHPHTEPQPFAISESTDAALVATTSETCSIKIDYRCEWCRAMNLKCSEDCRQSPPLRSLSTRASFVEHRIFQKWDNAIYKDHIRQFATKGLPQTGLRYFHLFHFDRDTILQVFGENFASTEPEQTRVWEKKRTGWESRPTDAVRLCNTSTPTLEALSAYIRSCRPDCVQHSPGDTILQELWQLVGRSLPMLQMTFDIWTANRMLMKGWQTRDSAYLQDRLHYACHNTGPTPRVLQNQLDQMLEEFIVTEEKKLLQSLEDAIFRRESTTRLDVMLTIILLLKVIEKDVWRLLHWVRHRSARYKWRHPSSAESLVHNGVFLSRMLLAYTATDMENHLPVKLAGFIQMTANNPTRYDELDDESTDGVFVRYSALKTDPTYQSIADSVFC